MTTESGHGPMSAVEFRERLGEMTQRWGELRTELAEEEDAAEVLTQHLDTAYEELRVADEEVRSQQEQIAALIEGQQLLRMKHERMLAALPVAVLTTDGHGLVVGANAAAANLVGLRISRIVGKPVFTFVSTEERPELRRQLAHQAREAGEFRQQVTLLPRDTGSIRVEASVSTLPGPTKEHSWMLLPAGAREATSPVGPDAVPRALIGIASLASQVRGLRELLSQAATICVQALGEAADVSLVVGHPLAPEEVLTTSKRAQELDGLQAAVARGPSVTAYDDLVTVLCADLRGDDRWPALREESVHVAAAAVSVPMTVGEQHIGVLSCYLHGADPDDYVGPCELMAATLAAAVTDLRLHDELESLAASMEKALTSRATIDQAKGIVMADRRCGPEEAFEYLVELSSNRHLKLRDVAQAIVVQASRHR